VYHTPSFKKPVETKNNKSLKGASKRLEIPLPHPREREEPPALLRRNTENFYNLLLLPGEK